MTTRAFVVGGAGFIGSHLVERLVERGPVTVFDGVTCLVPGDTGTNHPAGSPATMSCSRLTPASQTATPVAGSRLMIRFSRPVDSTRPPADCAALL